MMLLGRDNRGGGEHAGGRRRRRSAGVFFAAAMIAEILVLRLRGYRIGGNVVVRCQRDHLFTTIWIPGASVKSLRFGWWRFERCPVGNHWSMVTPVSEAGLSRREKRIARKNKDIRIP